MQRTNTIIIFPDAGDPNIPPIRKGSVTISGAIHNVYLARQLLLGSLPIVMMFDLPENIDIQEALIQKLQVEIQSYYGWLYINNMVWIQNVLRSIKMSNILTLNNLT